MSTKGYGSTVSSPITSYTTTNDTITSGFSVLSPFTELDEPLIVQSSINRDCSDRGSDKDSSDVSSENSRCIVERRQGLPSSLRLYVTSLSPRSLRRSYIHRRLPCNKNVWLVFLMFFLQGFAEYSTLLFLFFALDAYRPLNPPQVVASFLLIRCLVLAASPVVGFLADAYFGRYNTIKASLYMCLLGAVVLAVGFSTAKLDPWFRYGEGDHYHQIDFDGAKRWPEETVTFIGVLYAVMYVGLTGVTVNLIPFGVDQLPEASSGELSSYFHCYFWCVTAGELLSAAVLPYIYQHYSLGVVFLLPAVCFTGEILILILRRHEGFVIQPLIKNQFKLIYRVLKCSFSTKKPVFRSAFDIGRPPPSRIDRAMDINGGKFTVEQVQDVKTVLRILVILLSFFGYYAVSAQLASTYFLEGVRMSVPRGTYTNCTETIYRSTDYFVNATYSVECHKWNIPPSFWMASASFIPILALIPLVDRLFYVSCRPKMLKRIAAGNIFLLLSILVAVPVEIARMEKLLDQFTPGGNSTVVINAIPFHTASTTKFHLASPLSIAFIMPQYILFGFTKVFAKITVVEFIYAQSPGAMKGLLLGMLFFTSGMAMGFSSLLIFLQGMAKEFEPTSYFGNSQYNVQESLNCLSSKGRECVDGLLFSYIVLAVAVLVSFIVFIRAAYKYTPRRRGMEPHYNPYL